MCVLWDVLDLHARHDAIMAGSPVTDPCVLAVISKRARACGTPDWVTLWGLAASVASCLGDLLEPANGIGSNT